MKLRTYASLGFAFCVALPVLSHADERLSAEISSDSSIHADLEQHATDVRELDGKFQEAISRLEQSYVEERQTLRKALSQKLEKEKKALTKKGNLEPAVALRDYIERLEATPIAPPKPSGRVLEGTKANDPTFRVWAVRID